MTGFGFLRDINGDKCPRTLLGLVVGMVWVVLSCIVIIYGLKHTIQASSTIVDLLWAMAFVSGVLLGVTAFQKLRGMKDDK